MKRNLTLICLIFSIIKFNASGQALAQATVNQDKLQSKADCYRSIFVQSPVSDTYIVKDRDTLIFGHESTLKVRGLPDKKSMVSLISYRVHDLDAAYVKNSYLKVYAVSKKGGHRLTLFSLTGIIDEQATTWRNQPGTHKKIDSKVISEAPFVLFEVTEYVKGHLKDGFLNFHVQTDSKKTIDIASRESGLSAELIIETCTPQQLVEVREKENGDGEGWGLKVLPCALDGKFTIQLMGVPEGGYGDLMLMTEQGDILRQLPIAIQDADVCYHTLDLGDLLPGTYWAVLRKGRAMVKDHFRLRPKNGTTYLQVVLDESFGDEP